MCSSDLSLGGVVGHEVAETTDPRPARVDLVQRVTTAWLRTRLDVDAGAWSSTLADVRRAGDLGSITTR